MKGILADNLLIASLLICFIHNVLAVASRSRLVARQTAVDDVPLIGIIDGGPAPVVRMEINDMYKDKPLFNLYILALNRMMKAPRNHRTSYYAISAIHGTEQIYNDIRWGNPVGPGYCEHGTDFFASHHRVYVALYETSLYKYAKQIVDEFDPIGRPPYSNALKRFRVPYWDWGSNASLPNWILFDKNITIDIPSGRKLMSNPLYAFRNFAYGDPNLLIDPRGFGPRTTETVRSPAFNGSGTYVSQPANVARSLSEIKYVLRYRVYHLFANFTEWTRFNIDLIESIHNSPHLLVGGYSTLGAVAPGHMAQVRLSAFDPVSWLHHCNVDRQFAILQVISPKQFPGSSNATRALWPFWDYRRDRFFTAENSRNVTDFGYTYPELQQTTDANRMRQLMIQKYGASAPRNTIARATNTLSESEVSDKFTSARASIIAEAPIFDTVLHTPADPKKLASKGRAQLLNTTDSYNEYQAAIALPSDATTGSFRIHFFVGPYTSNSSQWTFDSNYVGSMDCFTLGSQSAMRIDIKGFVFLTQALLNLINRPNSGLTNLQVNDVRRFLKEYLKYEVQSSPDVKVDKGKIKIEVQTARVKTPKATKKNEAASSVWGPWRTVFTLK